MGKLPFSSLFEKIVRFTVSSAREFRETVAWGFVCLFVFIDEAHWDLGERDVFQV